MTDPLLFLSQGEINEKERQIRESLHKIETEGHGSLSLEELVSLRRDLAESKVLLDQHTKTISDITHEKEALDKKKLELDGRMGTLEQEYEELLDKTIAEEEISAQKNADMEETISTLKVNQDHIVFLYAHLTSFFFFITEQVRGSICIQKRNARKRN